MEGRNNNKFLYLIISLVELWPPDVVRARLPGLPFKFGRSVFLFFGYVTFHLFWETLQARGGLKRVVVAV